EGTHTDLSPDLLIPFIEGDDPRLAYWNVGIVESPRGIQSEEPLGTAGAVKLVRRARLDDSGPIADIKALMSKRDVIFDCSDEIDAAGNWDDLKEARQDVLGQVPMLLLYPIERYSAPERPSKVRVPLDAARDVLGIGLVFPGSVTEGGNYVSVNLQPISAEEIAEMELEEAEQAEAAGV